MEAHTVIRNGSVRFDGNCEETRSFCGAICCKRTVILLTEEEKNSGKYEFIEPTVGCECQSCQFLRPKNAAALRRTDDGCIHLDGANKCSIYDERPAACRSFDCPATNWSLVIPQKAK